MGRWLGRMIFIVVILILFLLVVTTSVMARALTRAGSWPITGTPLDAGLIYEDITLTTSDGLQLSGWHIPGSRPQAIVVVHGIYANKQAVMPAAIMLAEAGYPVVLIDLRGHGNSQGKQVSYGYREAFDVLAAVEYAAALPGVEQVGALGYSFGGSAVVRAAALDARLRAVIVQSSFSSLADAVDTSFSRFTGLPRWPLSPLLIKFAEWEVGITVDQVDSARDLAAMPPRPVFIIHGVSDDLFPVDHARKMFDAAQEPKELWLIEGQGHDYPMGHRAEYRERVLQFFDRAFR